MAKVKPRMTENEFYTFCAQYGVDPDTGLKLAAIKGVEIIYVTDNERSDAQFDEWAAKMRASEAPAPQPRFRWF